MKQLLFPEDSTGDASSNYLFGHNSKTMPVKNSLGGNLHELSDNQINKLISLKFNNHPISLIKQLSYDLALKELELILLRKEKFLREQGLLKMCNEYGNLSNLEIDKKLSSLQVDENVDDVLLGLIENAINDDMKKFDHRNPGDTATIDTETGNIAQAVTGLERPAWPTRPARWLSDWFKDSKNTNSSIEHLDKDVINSRNVRLGQSHLESSLASLPVTDSSSETKIPVELETINTRSLINTPDISMTASIDKYGFFSDPHEPCEKNTETLSRSKQDVSAEEEFGAKNKPLVSITETNSFKVNGTTDILLATPSIDKLKKISELHDAKNKAFEAKWDNFFKDMIKGYYKHVDLSIHAQDDHITSAISSNEMFGTQGLNLTRLDKSKFKSNSTNQHEMGNIKILRNLIRENGIPLKYRFNLWVELSGAKNLRVPGEFPNLVKEARNTKSEAIKSNIRQIDLDLHRTFPSNIYFNDLVNNQPGPNLYKLQNILYAFSVYNPDVGYCQGMNKIVGNLLLVDSRFSEEDIFWIFTAFLEEVVPKFEGHHFFNINSLPIIRIYQKILTNYYFPRLLPKLHNHFLKLNVQIEYITFNWWLLMFTDGLPLEIWFKLFDNFLVSNIETTFISLTLSVFKLFEKRLLDMCTSNDVYLFMKNLNHTSSASKISIRYHDLMSINSFLENKISKEDHSTLRDLYND